MRDNNNSGVNTFFCVILAVVVVVGMFVVAVVAILTGEAAHQKALERETAAAIAEFEAQAAEQQQQQEQEAQADAQALVQPKQSSQMAKTENFVDAVVSGYDDSVAVAVVPLDGSLGFSINGDEKFVSASMIKLLILAEYLDEVDSGVISPEAVWTRNASDVVGGTGVIQTESVTTYTYDELARYMIMYSDNTATNVLIDLMGMGAINAKAASLGLANTDLQRKMMDLNSGVENHISANDAATLLVGIANHTIASEASCLKAEEWLLMQTDTAGLIEGLPADVGFGHKTGDLNSIRHDGGIVYASYPYVIVTLTELGASNANLLMKQVSTVVYGEIG